MFLKQAFWCLVVAIGLCTANLGLNISDCVKDCKTKFLFTYRYLCDATCLQDALRKLVGNVTAKDYNRTLPKPVTPRLVGDPGWRTIRLHFNTTELKTYSDLNYILEVKPDWGHQQRNDSVLVFPFTKIYYHANQTTYFVEDLEPNTSYQFRVIALKQNKSSPFSNWSDVILTTKSCREPPCGPTNILLELMVRNRKRCQANKNLINSTFRWEPDTTASEKNKTDFNELVYTLTSLTDSSNCGVFSYNEFSLGWDNASHSYDADGKRLYFDCWYEIETKAERWITGSFTKYLVAANRSWIFHVPNDIKTRNGVAVSGCPATTQTHRGGLIRANRTRNTSDETLTISFNWATKLWKNVNWGYFRVKLSQQRKVISEECINAFANVDQYNMMIGNLTEGKKYDLYILAYDVDHCEEENLLTLSFKAILPCEDSNCSVSKPNSTCKETDLNEGSICECDNGFYPDKGTCVEKKPCKTHKCGKNEICSINGTGEVECVCNKPNFRWVNEQCVPIEDKKPEKSELDKGVIAAAVVTPLLVILIAVSVIYWLRKRHKKRMNFMEKEMEIAVDLGQMNSYLRSVDIGVPLDDNSDRLLNLLYISQDDAYEIPENLLEPINLLELPGGSIRLHSIIGRGEFGKVYVGEAQGINKNSEWTTVAIKTLEESANEEEVSDFLREIELMKDIGKHENIIEMYGCCTKYRPICLVLEYAPGGNLLNYLRSLKKKCKDIAAARLSEITQSNKEKSQNLDETDLERDMPEDSAFLFPNESREQNVTENQIQQAQDFNFEIASKINEEVCSALDPKELESFARQIAAGMKHVSDLCVVHRDLAARNILIGENKVLKISDFGLSREGTYVKKSTGKVPFRWLSIEAMQERTYSTASDVWAFGVVLWEICTLGDVPYSSILDRNLKDFLLDGNRLEKVGSCTDDIYDIMLKCWSHLPKDRPTFDELTKKLWDLEHTGSSYVNLERLLQQSVESEG